jgi:hypothetical protein
VRLAGRKRHARFESSEALAELPAVARTAVFFLFVLDRFINSTWNAAHDT